MGVHGIFPLGPDEPHAQSDCRRVADEASNELLIYNVAARYFLCSDSLVCIDRAVIWVSKNKRGPWMEG